MPNPEILVVGGGPGGAAASYHLASGGHDVLVVEKKEFPREKTCGDGLTPRSIHELTLMGFDFAVPEFYKVEGLRAYAGDRMIELEWPDHPTYPNWGGVMRRIDLDQEVIRLAEKQGAVLRTGTTARPIVEDGRLAAVELISGGETEIVHPRVVVVADGSLSRFGRGLGAARDFDKPYGLAARGYYASPRSNDRFIESHLSLSDAAGATVPGYGWIFPLGDGEVNVGVGVLSTFHRWKEVNTSTLMESLEATAPDSWRLSPATASCPWLSRSDPRWAPTGCWWVMPPGRSIRSTGRGSPTPTRQDGSQRATSTPPWRPTTSLCYRAIAPNSTTPTGSTTGPPGPSSGRSGGRG
jgi:geranylgeranyl reductase family protein